MPSYNKECFCKEKSPFQETIDNLAFPDCYTEVSNAMATVVIKAFLWNLNFAQEYLSRKK